MSKLITFLCITLFIFSCKAKLRKKKLTYNTRQQYCFQIIDSSIFYNPTKNGITLYAPSLEWYDEYCNGICRQDSIVLHSYRNGNHHLDTIQNPAFAKKFIKGNAEITSSDKGSSIYKNLLHDSLLLIGYKKGVPIYDTIRK